MIYGIGADLVEVPRVEQLLARYGERFARRVLSQLEWDGFLRSGTRHLYVAGRFAAKEAFAKALGTGLRYPVSLTRISIVNDALGKPALSVDEPLQNLLSARGVGTPHVTLTHERSMACAVVVLERSPA